MDQPKAETAASADDEVFSIGPVRVTPGAGLSGVPFRPGVCRSGVKASLGEVLSGQATSNRVLVLFMTWTAPPLPTGLSDRLALIIAGLRGMVAAHMAKDQSAVAVLFLGWTRLGRLASRFEALVAAVRAERLPAGPESRVQSAADLELPRLEGLPQPFRLPGRFGWLVRLVPGAAVYGIQLQYLLADP
ncbi:MAG: hypothetical protein JOY71_28395, partial [Acetobacteraceae bacterium]|nr:hypothetical protein [Acetobacteraceae bacterium]